MRIDPLPIAGAYLVTPDVHTDPRGTLTEWFRPDLLHESIGEAFTPVQSNISVSGPDIVRGMHFTSPGQAKYVTCAHGELFDVIVDIRVGSPTFGEMTTLRLDGDRHLALYLAAGLGHGYCALTEDTTVIYLCPSTYVAGAERSVHPLDPELGIPWPTDAPVLSQRDADAYPLATMRERGLLPRFHQD